jgi:hypothetical protein
VVLRTFHLTVDFLNFPNIIRLIKKHVFSAPLQTEKRDDWLLITSSDARIVVSISKAGGAHWVYSNSAGEDDRGLEVNHNAGSFTRGEPHQPAKQVQIE